VSTLVIAEVGVNHDGDFAKALELVAAASEVGADVCKFQMFEASELSTKAAPKAPYQLRKTRPEESQFQMLSRLSLGLDEFLAIKDECDEHHIEFLCTAFDPTSLREMAGLGMRRIKIPSGEITNLPLLRATQEYRLPILLSTGMSSLSEVGDALKVLSSPVAGSREVTILHCTSQYPAPVSSVNLKAMVTMRNDLQVPVGYSDHTMGWDMPVAAVALGASVIEKHITLDSAATGPDHAASLEPDQFAEMVRAIRMTETSLGDGTKVPHPAEEDVKRIARRSVVARRPIHAGHILTADDLAVKRPGEGVSPMLWDSILGSRAIRSFERDEAIEL